MGVLQRVVKPRNQKSKRALEDREAKLIENNKSTLIVRGTNCSATVLQCLKELHSLKKPDCEFYNQKNDIRPFENFSKLEFFGQKNDASLFAFGNSNKKRPNNLILGRLFDHKMLDMVEFGIEDFKSLQDFPATDKIPVGTKPILLFSGSEFDSDEDMKRIKNLFIDFFRGPKVPKIRLQGLEHAIQFTATVNSQNGGGKKIYLRSYKIALHKSGSKTPRIELEDHGPHLDLSLRRTHLASEDLFKSACKQVKNTDKPKKVKNVSKDAFGSTLGRLHVPAQKIGTIQTRKMKGLKATPDEVKQKKIQEKKAKAEKNRQQNIAAVFSE